MPAKWYNATLLDYTDINSTTRNFIFRVAEDIQFTWKGGQFITLDLPVGSKRVDRWRSYSIASIPNSSHTFELCIVKNPQGLGTTYLFNQLRQGDKITFKGPEGSFVVAPSTPETEHIMICTGTGIAPCRSMIHEMYSMDIPFKNIHLIFGTRHSHGLLYKSEWEQRVKQDKRFIYDPILSREKRSDMVSG